MLPRSVLLATLQGSRRKISQQFSKFSPGNMLSSGVHERWRLRDAFRCLSASVICRNFSSPRSLPQKMPPPLRLAALEPAAEGMATPSETKHNAEEVIVESLKKPVKRVRKPSRKEEVTSLKTHSKLTEGHEPVVKPDSSSSPITSSSSLLELGDNLSLNSAEKRSEQSSEQSVAQEIGPAYYIPRDSEKVLVVDTEEVARKVVHRLTTELRDRIFACDTEVADIDIKKESPVGKGTIVCFSVYGGPDTDMGDGHARLWVDVWGTKKTILDIFGPFFTDPGIRKVWHNYSFDSHILANHGIKAEGFHADTMHLARLWNTCRKGKDGGYSLESLSRDRRALDGRDDGAMKDVWMDEAIPIGKISLKEKFGVPVLRKDGTPGKTLVVPPVDQIHCDVQLRDSWIEYSVLDAVATFVLWSSLHRKLSSLASNPWQAQVTGEQGSMYDFYERYWQPFCEVLIGMEREGMHVDRAHLAAMQEKALEQQLAAQSTFRQWAQRYCPGAMHMNVGSDSQIRQLLFGGVQNRKKPGQSLPTSRVFQVPNSMGYIEEGRKVAKKTMPITLTRLLADGESQFLEGGATTKSGWPAVNGQVLKQLAGSIAYDFSFVESDSEVESDGEAALVSNSDSQEMDAGESGGGGGEAEFSADDLDHLLDLKHREAIRELRSVGGLDALDIDAVMSRIASRRSRTGEAGFEPGSACASIPGDSEEDVSMYGTAYRAFGGGQQGKEACLAFSALCESVSINTLLSNFILPLQGNDIVGPTGRVHCSLNINTETGRLSARKPSLQNQPAMEKDRYRIRQAFGARHGNRLIVADYGQLELRLLAHLAGCKSMLAAFEAGGDFHSRTALNMYPHVREAVERGEAILEWDAAPGESGPPAPLLKDKFRGERQKAKMLNFSIAYGKTPMGLAKDWKVSKREAEETLRLWYSDRPEVEKWQKDMIAEAHRTEKVCTLLGRSRHLPGINSKDSFLVGHLERAAINAPVQGSAADIAMLAMLRISRHTELEELGYKLVLQVHDEVILEGPDEHVRRAQDIVVDCMERPFFCGDDSNQGQNLLLVGLVVDAKNALDWYSAK